jgi:chromate transport protein ChrA
MSLLVIFLVLFAVAFAVVIVVAGLVIWLVMRKSKPGAGAEKAFPVEPTTNPK